jgi:hypothetical protein
MRSPVAAVFLNSVLAFFLSLLFRSDKEVMGSNVGVVVFVVVVLVVVTIGAIFMICGRRRKQKMEMHLESSTGGGTYNKIDTSSRL